MTESRAAVRYAKATLELAIDSKINSSIETDMRFILDTLKENPDLQEVLSSPVIKGDQKKEVLLNVFEQSETLTKNLISLLVDNKRISHLEEVANKYIFLNDLVKGEKVAEITTAIPITAELEDEILERVEKITGTKVALENKIDEEIIGGFILRIGDMQYNASVADQLSNLKREFTNS